MRTFVHRRKQDNRFFRQLSRCIPHGYLLVERRLNSLVVPVTMNDELAEMQAARKNASEGTDRRYVDPRSSVALS